MSLSETSTRSRPKARIALIRMITPATIVGARVGVDADDRAALLERQRGQPRAGLLHAPSERSWPSTTSGSKRSSAELDRGQGGRRAGDGDRAVGRAGPGCEASSASRIAPDVVAERLELLRPGWVGVTWRSLWRTTPSCSEVWKSGSGPEPTISSVEPPPMSTTSVVARCRGLVAERAAVGEPRLLEAVDAPSRRARSARAARPGRRRRCWRRGRRWSRRRSWRRRRAARRSAGSRRRRRARASIASVASWPDVSSPRPRPVTRDSLWTASARPPVDVGDEEPGRVGTHVDGCDAQADGSYGDAPAVPAAEDRGSAPGERHRVARRERLPVVVQVGEHVDARAPGGDPPPPGGELGVGVVAAAAVAAAVQAQERPRRGDLARGEGPLGVVGDHQRGIVAREQPVDGGGEPARMAELESVPAGRQQRERPPRRSSSRRKLPGSCQRIGPERPASRSGSSGCEETLDALGQPEVLLRRVGEPLDVGQVAARLDREQEAARGLLDPGRDRLRLRGAVEGRVDLDRVEQLRVAGEPAPRGQPLRVDDAAPAPCSSSPSSRPGRARTRSWRLRPLRRARSRKSTWFCLRMIRCSSVCSSASERPSRPVGSIAAWSASTAFSSVSISHSTASPGSPLHFSSATSVVGSPPSATIFSTSSRASPSSSCAYSQNRSPSDWNSKPNSASRRHHVAAAPSGTGGSAPRSAAGSPPSRRVAPLPRSSKSSRSHLDPRCRVTPTRRGA